MRVAFVCAVALPVTFGAAAALQDARGLDGDAVSLEVGSTAAVTRLMRRAEVAPAAEAAAEATPPAELASAAEAAPPASKGVPASEVAPAAGLASAAEAAPAASEAVSAAEVAPTAEARRPKKGDDVRFIHTGSPEQARRSAKVVADFGGHVPYKLKLADGSYEFAREDEVTLASGSARAFDDAGDKMVMEEAKLHGNGTIQDFPKDDNGDPVTSITGKDVINQIEKAEEPATPYCTGQIDSGYVPSACQDEDKWYDWQDWNTPAHRVGCGVEMEVSKLDGRNKTYQKACLRIRQRKLVGEPNRNCTKTLTIQCQTCTMGSYDCREEV